MNTCETGRSRADRPNQSNPRRTERGVQHYTEAELVDAYRGVGLTDAQIFGYVPDELPPPPDNFDLWNSFPEDFREQVANKFMHGCDAVYDDIRARVQREYAVARANQREKEARRNQPQRGRHGGRR